MNKSLFIVIGVFVSAALGINVFLVDPSFTDLRAKAAYYKRTNNPRAAEQCFIDLLQRDSNNIDAHYSYILAHYRLPKREKKGRYDYIERDDRTIRDYYYAKVTSADSLQRDIGFYGWGLCWLEEEDYPFALERFDSVHNKQLKYLNNSRGYALKALGGIDTSEPYFRSEIQNNGNVEGAYTNLIEVLFAQKKLAELNKLLHDTATRKYFSPHEKRRLYFLQGQFGNYLRSIALQISGRANSSGFIGAVIILLCWLFFLRRIDVFESEKWIYLVITCLLGMLFSAGTYLITDAIHEYLHFDLNGAIVNDFFYSILGIGAVEELVKFLPLLIMLAFTKQVNEPIDYIIYASVSALGFAFIENLLYFDADRLYIIHGRALTAVISHMFDASVIAYGLILCRYRKKRNVFVAFLLFFFLAAFTHGFYDFWLVNKHVTDFRVITLLFMLGTFFCYNWFISNALNNSSFFSPEKIIDATRLKDFLFYALSSVVLVEYLIMSFTFGPTAGNLTLLQSISSGAYLIFFLATSLSNYQIRKGEWKPLFDWAKAEE